MLTAEKVAMARGRRRRRGSDHGGKEYELAETAVVRKQWQ